MLVHLRKGMFPKGIYHKLASQKIGRCKIVKKINHNAYVVELLHNLQINPNFSIADLFEFHGFDENIGLSVDKERSIQIPKKAKEVIEEILDMKGAQSRRGNQNRRFLIKSLDKPTTKGTWISKELKRIDPTIL